MEKNIKDYLHLYLGCEVWICKNLEGNDVVEPLTTKMLHEDGEMWDEEDLYKPILRPLSDMTDEEKEEEAEFAFTHPEDVYGAAKQIKYLLSKHFDLFGLIDAGLAIDKNTLNNQS